MTVAATPLREEYTGNNAQTLFDYTWKVADASHLLVTLVYIPTGLGTTLTLNTHYTVNGVLSDNQTLWKVSVPYVPGEVFPLTNNYKLVITSNLPAYQGTGYTNQNSVPPAQIETDLDYVVRLIKQIIETQTRTVTLPVGSDLDPVDYLTTLGTLLLDAQAAAQSADGDAADAQTAATAAIAAAASINLPAIAGNALKYLRVKSDASGYEFRTAANIIADLGLATDAELAAALTSYYTSGQVDTLLTTVNNTVVPRKVQDLMRTGKYGRQQTSIFFNADSLAYGTAPSVGTFTRATVAQAANRARTLGNWGSGSARYDTSYKDGKFRGILMEGARTNLASYSEDLTNAVWTKTGVTITANTGLGPYSTAVLDTAKETAVNAAHYAWSRAFTITAADSLEVSEWVIADGTNQFVLLTDITGGAFASATFTALNTANPVPNKNGPTSGGAVVCTSAEIEDWTHITPGLFRCKASFQTVGQTTANVYHRMADASLNMSYLGNVANGQKVGCIQVEIGGSATGGHQRSTTYIPAVAATATRNADTWSFVPANFDYLASEGTLFFVGQLDSLTEVNTGSPLLSLDDGTTNNSIALVVDNAGNISLGVTVGNVSQYGNTVASAIPANQEFCVAARFKAGNFQIAVNGVLGVAGATGSLPAITQFQVGRYGNIWNLFGAARMFGVINAALPDADLQDISKWLRVA